MPADSVPGEGSLSGLQEAAFSLCQPVVKKESSGLSASSYKDANPNVGALLSILPLNLITSLRGHLQIPSH